MIFVGWRGEPGIKDEPQHIPQGKITIKLLKSLKIKYEIINENEDQFNNIVNPINSKNYNDEKEIRWIGNDDKEIDQVFGFNENAELVNSRAAMIGFIMLILTELALGGDAVTSAIFGIN